MPLNFPFSSYPQLDVVTAAPQAGFRCDPSAFNRLRTSCAPGAVTGTTRQTADSLINVDLSGRQGYREDYSIRDAAESLWRQENTVFNIYDPASIEKMQERIRSGLYTISPTEEELTAYIDKLRQNGLDGTVDWSGLSREFGAFKTTTPEELSDGLDYLASRYAAVLDKLERNFSGDLLAEQKAKLNELWQSATSGMIDSYTSRLQENLGVSNADAQLVRDSFSVILDEKIAAYQGALERASGDLSGPDARWLQNCDAYMAARLREQDTGEGTSAFYTVQDLTAAGQLSQLYQTEISNASSGQPNEAVLALKLAMADMMGEEMISRGLVSGNMAALIRGSRTQGHENVLNAAAGRLVNLENARPAGTSAGSFGAVNRGVFQGIYQTAMDKFRETGGDAAEAIRAGAAYGRTATAQAHTQDPKVSRWGISMEQYWKDFYTAPTYRESSELDRQIDKLLEQAGRTSGRNNSAFQNFVNIWHNFINSIGGGFEARA